MSLEPGDSEQEVSIDIGIRWQNVIAKFAAQLHPVLRFKLVENLISLKPLFTPKSLRQVFPAVLLPWRYHVR